MKKRTLSAISPTSYNLLRSIVCTSAALAIAMGQSPSTPANPAYPLDMKTRWTYEMRQEFSPGVRPSELDAALSCGS